MTYPLRLAGLYILLGSLITQTGALAQTKPATTAPVAEGAKVELPKGYVRIEVNGRSLICLPEDKKWIEAGAARVQAGNGPTTRPADLLATLAVKRDLLVAAVLKDLPTLKPSQIDKLIDESMIPALKQLTTIQPTMVYIVSPAEHLKQAMRNGWTDRRFRYNKLNDAIDFDRTVSLTTQGSGEESAVAALFRPGDSEDQRTTSLAVYIADTEAQVQQSIASRGTSQVLILMADFIAQQAMSDLPRKEDQVWLVTGLSNVLAARYVSIIHGSPLVQFIEAMVVGPADSPVVAAGVDLLHPLPVSSLKDEFVPAHMDARRRKAIAVMYVWLTGVGDAKLMPTIEAVQRHRPADGDTLVSLIKDTSGMDLSTQLKAR